MKKYLIMGLLLSNSLFAAPSTTSVQSKTIKPNSKEAKALNDAKSNLMKPVVDIKPKLAIIEVNSPKKEVIHEENIILTNNSSEPRIYSLNVLEYNPSDKGKIDLGNLGNKQKRVFSLSKNIVNDNENFSFAPNETRTIKLKIKIEPSMQGSYYALLSFSENHAKEEEAGMKLNKAGMAFDFKVISSFILTIKNGEKKISEKITLDKNKLNFSFKNIGNTLIKKPKVMAYVFDNNKKLLDKIELLPIYGVGNAGVPQEVNASFTGFSSKKLPSKNIKIMINMTEFDGDFASSYEKTIK